jgi:hypothetical protein
MGISFLITASCNGWFPLGFTVSMDALDDKILRTFSTVLKRRAARRLSSLLEPRGLTATCREICQWCRI